MSKSLECPVCMVDYNTTSQLPKMNPMCGHTVCKECLLGILKKPQPKCPLDNRPFTSQSIENFPTNFTLMDLIEENKKAESKKEERRPEKREENEVFKRCPIHSNKPIEYFCYNCRKDICAGCFIMEGNHKYHKVIELAQIKSRLRLSKEEVQYKLDNLKNIHRRLNDEAALCKTNSVKEVEKQFDNLIYALQSKKKSFLNSLEKHWEEEEKDIDGTYGKDSALRTNLTELIALSKENINNQKSEFLLKLGENLDETNTVLNQAPTTIANYQQRLSQLPLEIASNFRSHINYINDILIYQAVRPRVKNIVNNKDNTGKKRPKNQVALGLFIITIIFGVMMILFFSLPFYQFVVILILFFLLIGKSKEYNRKKHL